MISLLYEDRALATFYDTAQRPERRDFEFCLKLADGAGSVLDLGCGTGELAIALTDETSSHRHVVGLDPAASMLALAASKEGGDQVHWVQGDARSARLGEVFDFVVLTGHAFQVFLTEADRAACLSTIACHLAPDGVFVFDTRNPHYTGAKENSREKSLRRFQHPQLGQIEAWNQSRYDKEQAILTYSNHYRVLETGEERSGQDQIAYTSQPDLAGLIKAAGLRVDRWLGDWDGSPFSAESYDIIPVGRLAP